MLSHDRAALLVAYRPTLPVGLADAALDRDSVPFSRGFSEHCTSAFLMFYERVLYPAYETVPRVTGMSPLEDQAAAGAIMWVQVPSFFSFQLAWLPIKLLSTRRTLASRSRPPDHSLFELGERTRSAGPAKPARVDLLSLPFIGRLLGWPQFRRATQLVMAFVGGSSRS